MHYQHSSNDDATGRILEGLQCDRSGCVCHTAARAGKGLTHCPAHNDRAPSLSVSPPSRTAWPLVHCFAGCTHAAVLGALRDRELVPRSVGFGVGAWTHYREDRRGEAKRVRWTPGAEPRAALYRAESLAELDPGATVLLTEGEAACEAAIALGFEAVATACGASATPDDAALEVLRGFDVVMCQDNDDPGHQHMQRIGQRLAALGVACRWLELPDMPEHGDVADYSGSRGELAALVAAAPVWTPSAEPGPVETSAGGEVRLWPCSDSGNGEMFARLNAHDVRYDWRQGRWLVFRGHHWRVDTTGEITLRAIAAARHRLAAAAECRDVEEARQQAAWAFTTERNKARLDAMISLARSQPGIADDGSNWDANPDVIGVQNGTLDLRTGELRPGRPEDRITRSVGFDYRPGAPCDRWRQYLREVTGGDLDLADYLQRVFGYLLTGEVSEQVFFVARGHGSNGKTVFLSILGRVAGGEDGYALTVPFAMFERGKDAAIRHDIAGVYGKRVVVAAETAPATKMNEARLKELSGGDRLSARRLYQEAFSFEPTHKIVLALNDLPPIDDRSLAFWRRCRVLPFDVTFEGANREADLDKRLLAEIDGIFAWAVEGAMQWYSEGLGMPAAVRGASEAYRRDSDPLGDFLEDDCTIAPGESVSARELFAAYERHAWAAGLRERDCLNATAFGRAMAARFERRKTATGRCYVGIGLADTAKSAGFSDSKCIVDPPPGKLPHEGSLVGGFSKGGQTLQPCTGELLDHHCPNGDYVPLYPGEACASCGEVVP